MINGTQQDKREKGKPMTVIDPISRDVFQHQVQGVAEEMSVALRRAAFSSIIYDMYDYACGLFTPEGEMISQAETIPVQLGIMPTAIRYMFMKIPPNEWRQGDVIVCNDPYQGCTHTLDICLFSPVFANGELIALTSTLAHHIDLGGVNGRVKVSQRAAQNVATLSLG